MDKLKERYDDLTARWEHIGVDGMVEHWRRAVLASGESRVASMLMADMSSKFGPMVLDGLPFSPDVDKVVREYKLPHGRVDFAIFHADGSLSLIEVKDGSTGMRSVLGGIGQVCMYSLDAGMQRGSPSVIRRALAFTSTGFLEHDLLIELSCERAGVVPIQLGPLRKTMAPVLELFGVPAE